MKLTIAVPHEPLDIIIRFPFTHCSLETLVIWNWVLCMHDLSLFYSLQIQQIFTVGVLENCHNSKKKTNILILAHRENY